ncbi:MAG: ABC transporter [Planctomycetaceae bacterium]|nr:ABC transporter [Planctomycetaceae bacterium]
MIETRNLVKNYGDQTAVAGISFHIRPGEVTGYLGPNGAGKSTTVKMITGILPPSDGEVEVCGFDIVREPLEVKRRIGYVPESAALYTSLTPNEYLSLVSELHELEKSEAADRIKQLLEALQVNEVADRQMETFSKGMRQKILLISALLHDPEVVLFDEPLNGLDVNSALTLRRLIEGLAERGKTVLYCSHILDVVERLCSRVLVIDNGAIVADDSTQNLLAGSRQGTLESVFQDLTRRGDADEWVGSFLDQLDSK